MKTEDTEALGRQRLECWNIKLQISPVGHKKETAINCYTVHIA